MIPSTVVDGFQIRKYEPISIWDKVGLLVVFVLDLDNVFLDFCFHT